MVTSNARGVVIPLNRERAVVDHRATYSFGDFLLVPALFELRSRGKPVPCAPKVFDLVLYLIENRSHVVTHTEIRAALWPAVTVTEASLTYTVMAARRILGDTGRAQTVIRNIRGRGYRFIAEVDGAGE
jgi:DNA-binding winged helix-turn-helix (wHTH) protein